MRHVVYGLIVTATAMLATRPAGASDAQIAQQIASQLKALQNGQQLKGFHIGVKVDEGKVSMKGQVSTPEQQVLALDVARRVPGVKLVVNELQVVSNRVPLATSNRPATTAQAAVVTNTPTLAPAQPIRPQPALRQPTSTLASSLGAVVKAFGTRASEPQPASQATAQAAPTAPLAQPETSALPQPEPQTSQLMIQSPQGAAPAPVVSGDVSIASTAPAAPQLPLPVQTAMGSGVAQQSVGYSAVPSLQIQPQAVANVGQVPAQPFAIPSETVEAPHRAYLANAPARPIRVVSQSSTSDDVGVLEAPMPIASPIAGGGSSVASVMYDHPNMPSHAWPSYAAYPNYAGVTYPTQYSPTAWPYIGPFYPYPQVPLGWRKVSLEWDDGWWFLDFTSKH